MASQKHCKDECDCSGWDPIPLKPNLCNVCGHSIVFHNEEEVAAVPVNQDRRSEPRSRAADELAPIKRKSVVATMIPVFSGKHNDQPPPKISPPRRVVHKVPSTEDDEASKREAERRRKQQEEEDELARRIAKQKKDEEDARLAQKKKEEEDELARRLAQQKLDEENAKKLRCAHCSQIISGGYMIFPDRGDAKVHNSCQEAYLRANCDKCAHCNDVLFPVPGKFKGEFMLVAKEKVHVECYEAYQTAQAASKGGGASSSAPAAAAPAAASSAGECKQCGKPLSGSFVRYPNGDKIHQDCTEAYIIATSDKCGHCGGPIAVIASKYDGTYYIVGDSKIHTECWSAYEAKK